MPRLLLFAPCRIAIIDGSTNLLSLVSVVEGLAITQFPGAINELTVVTAWQRMQDEEGATMIQQVTLVDADDRPVMTVETPFIFANLGHRVVNRLAGIPINGPGRYEFRLFIKPQGAHDYPEHPVGSYPVLIQNAPAAQIRLGM